MSPITVYDSRRYPTGSETHMSYDDRTRKSGARRHTQQRHGSSPRTITPAQQAGEGSHELGFFFECPPPANGSPVPMAKPWEELHTKIATNEEYEKSIAYKGLTCVCSTLSLRVALLRLPAQPFPGRRRAPRAAGAVCGAVGLGAPDLGTGVCGGDSRYGGACRMVRAVDCGGANAQEAAVGHGRRAEV